MQVKVKNNIRILSFSMGDLDVNWLTNQVQQHQKQHVILLITSETPSEKDLNFFLNLSSERKTNGTSFVVVNDKISIDNAPEGLNIVPTFVEAEDIIEMENIERELGF